MLRLILNFLEHVKIGFSAISGSVPILIKPLGHCDGIELFSLRFLLWFAETSMDCWWNKALLRVVVALEVHEE